MGRGVSERYDLFVGLAHSFVCLFLAARDLVAGAQISTVPF